MQIPKQESRFSSYLPVDILRFKRLPFLGVDSATLLDLSAHGWKLEMTSDSKISPESHRWLSIPTHLFGSSFSYKRLVLPVVCRWFDAVRFRMGGEFLNLSTFEEIALKKAIDSLELKILER